MLISLKEAAELFRGGVQLEFEGAGGNWYPYPKHHGGVLTALRYRADTTPEIESRVKEIRDLAHSDFWTSSVSYRSKGVVQRSITDGEISITFERQASTVKILDVSVKPK